MSVRVSVDTLVESGKDTNKFYLKELEEVPTGAIEVGEEDLIVRMTEGGSYGHTIQTKKVYLVHEKLPINIDGDIELKDIPVTEVMGVGEEKTREMQSRDRKWMAIACFSEKGTLIYGYYGKINDFDGDPNADDFAVIKYNYVPENYVEVTVKNAQA